MRALPRLLAACSLLISLLLSATSVYAGTEEDFGNLPWQKGPVTGELGNIARVEIPAGYAFLGQNGMERFNQLTQNLPNPDAYGVIISSTNSEFWFAVFSFDEQGYVKDDEGRSLDADKLITTLREATVAANKERSQRGWPTLTLNDWTTRPFYNPDGHHLEWGLDYTSTEPNDSTSEVVNHHIKLLGRDGVMTCTIVGSANVVPAAAEEMRAILVNYSFAPGRRYEEYRNGDKVAAVGLTGLILGGAAVAAAKSGLWAKLLKPILVGIGALFLGLIRRIGGLFKGRSNDDSNPSA